MLLDVRNRLETEARGFSEVVGCEGGSNREFRCDVDDFVHVPTFPCDRALPVLRQARPGTAAITDRAFAGMWLKGATIASTDSL